MIEEEIIAAFKTLYQMQHALSKITNGELLAKYGILEVHCIDAIGRLGTPNGTQLAQDLQITRSAISKVVRRLEHEKLIRHFQKPDNQKEILYQLTKTGQQVFNEHDEAHKKWEQREGLFLEKCCAKEKTNLIAFLRKYNTYLGELIKDNEGK